MRHKEKSKGELFYGWIIVFISLIILSVVFGIRYSYGVFLNSLEVEFGWDRITTSGVYSTYIILSSIFGFLGGWLFDIYGPRRVVILSGFIMGFGLILTCQIINIWQFYFTFSFLLALGTSSIWTILMANASIWFVRKKGLALGIISTGAGLGPMIMVPCINYIISYYDWRLSFFVLGLVAWSGVIPSAFFLKKPTMSKSFKNGLSGKLGLEHENIASSMKPEFNFTILSAFRKKEIWLIFLVWFCYSFVLNTVMIHIVPYAIDVGISSTNAAKIISFISGFSILGRLIMGRASDIFGRGKISIYCTLLQALAMLWLIGADEVWMFYLFAITYGFGYGGLDPSFTGLISDIFELSHIGKIIAVSLVGWGIGGMVGPVFTGYFFDIQGGYSFAFFSGFLFMLLAVIFIPLLKKTVYSDGE